MSPLHRLTLPCLLLAVSPLAAWSPAMYEAQTRMAMSQVPPGLRAFLEAHRTSLMEGARGLPQDRVPLIEEIEEQFQSILRMSQDGRSRSIIARELGTLAHMVQLLCDPSIIQGATPLRAHFAQYADSELPRLVLTREPFWGHKGVPDIREHLKRCEKLKNQRHQALASTFDERTGQRTSPWDSLSPAAGVLQTSYTTGVYTTANLWMCLYRIAGEAWES